MAPALMIVGTGGILWSHPSWGWPVILSTGLVLLLVSMGIVPTSAERDKDGNMRLNFGRLPERVVGMLSDQAAAKVPEGERESVRRAIFGALSAIVFTHDYTFNDGTGSTTISADTKGVITAVYDGGRLLDILLPDGTHLDMVPIDFFTKVNEASTR